MDRLKVIAILKHFASYVPSCNLEDCEHCKQNMKNLEDLAEELGFDQVEREALVPAQLRERIGHWD